jgi:hypothetical protein
VENKKREFPLFEGRQSGFNSKQGEMLIDIVINALPCVWKDVLLLFYSYKVLI